MRTASSTWRLTGAGLLLALAGCTSAGGEAPGPGATTAARAVEEEICALVADGAMSPDEVETLGRVLDRAHSLGLPKAVLDPAHEIVSAGEAPKPAVQKLRTACR
jgi:hypothetical protein